jgi:hypothetical protein
MNKYCLTFDIDWAPDFMIRKVVDKLIEKKIKATWFVTHKSLYIESLYDQTDLFEFGIHPNFLNNSSHGSTEEEVLKHICNIVPFAKSARSHTLFQSSRLLSRMVEDFNIEVDCNILLYKNANIEPHKLSFNHGTKELIRVPFFWEDDACMYDKEKSWDIKSPVLHSDGLKVFNFHPTFIYLNCDTIDKYDEMKKIKHLTEVNESDAEPFINKNSKGDLTFFDDLLNYIQEKEMETYTMADIAKLFYNV